MTVAERTLLRTSVVRHTDGHVFRLNRSGEREGPGLNRLRKNSLFLSGSCPGDEFCVFWVCLAVVCSAEVASGGRFIGLRAHFCPTGPAIEPESVCACAPRSEEHTSELQSPCNL